MITKTAGKIISLFLVLSLIASGISLFPKGDVTRNGDVDLADVIVSVRQVVRAATDEAVLRVGMENALTSLSIVAGIKKCIKSDGGIGYRSNDSSGQIPALIAGHHEELLPLVAEVSVDRSFLYISPILTPLTPPLLSV